MIGHPGSERLTVRRLLELVDCYEARLSISGAVLDRCRASQLTLLQAAATSPVYGLNTGYGGNATSLLDATATSGLQARLAGYLDCGYGEMQPERVGRAALAARLWVLAQGYSAVSPNLVTTMAELFSAGISPVIPRYGSLGASGDLVSMAPLARLLSGASGPCWFKGQLLDGPHALKEAGIKPHTHQGRDALAVMNGLSAVTALTALQADAASRLMGWSLRSMALAAATLGVFPDAYAPGLNSAPVRQFSGQAAVAARLRQYGQVVTSAKRGHDRLVQDEYSLRCVPQVLGPVVELGQLYTGWIEAELNSISDNPVTAPGEAPLSGGNFLGGYSAMVADGLALALSRLGDLLERQTFLMVDGKHGLPANLVVNGPGLAYRHGVKGVHQTASALAMELQRLALPAAVFSRSSEVHNQDIVSNAMNAATKLAEAIHVTAGIAAAHSLIACEAASQAQTLPTSGELAHWYQAVRRCVAPLQDDRPLRDELAALAVETTTHAFSDLLF